MKCSWWVQGTVCRRIYGQWSASGGGHARTNGGQDGLAALLLGVLGQLLLKGLAVLGVVLRLLLLRRQPLLQAVAACQITLDDLKMWSVQASSPLFRSNYHQQDRHLAMPAQDRVVPHDCIDRLLGQSFLAGCDPPGMYKWNATVQSLGAGVRAWKDSRKKTAVRRMATRSPPGTSTPIATSASMHLLPHTRLIRPRALGAYTHTGTAKHVPAIMVRTAETGTFPPLALPGRFLPQGAMPPLR